MNIEISQEALTTLKNTGAPMRMLIEYVGEISREYNPNHFEALTSSIIYQQLASKAADAIWNRFVTSIETVTPEAVAKAAFDGLKACGISTPKINYIKNISTAVLDGLIDFSQFPNLSDEEIIQKLTQIKGVGRWTAEMFLIFSLNRPDVLSFTDLGLKKGIQWLYGLTAEPKQSEWESYKRLFSPYGSIASFYLWEITIQKLYRYPSVNELNKQREGN